MAAVSIVVFMCTLDGSIVNIALPVLEQDLNAGFASVQWVVLGYMLVTATLLLSIGRLADMIGKKSIYITGVIIFTISSALCGISSSIEMLIASRILQGVGAAMVMALGTAIVTEAFPPSERGKALGLIGLMVSVGGISGPTVGGLILGSFTWHWIFLVNLPFGLIGALMVIRFVPAVRPPGGEPFDFRGAAALFFCLFCLLMAMTTGQTTGFLEWSTLVLFAGFLVSLAAFLWIEQHTTHPVIDLGMFHNRLFSVNLVTGSITFICSAGLVLLLPFYLENVLQFDSRLSGLLLSTVPIAMGITAPLAGALSDRFGSRPLTVIGLAVLFFAYISANTLAVDTTFWGYFLRLLPVGVGMGLFQSPNNSAIMGSAPRERLGVASGLLSMTRLIGQTAGISILGALWASRVAYYAGTALNGEATSAPAIAQVSALHNALLVCILLILGAFLLSLTALVKEKKAADLPIRKAELRE